MRAKIGDLVSPRTGRRTHWIGIVIKQREAEEQKFGDHKSDTDYLVQWARDPKHRAWWIDWSLEVVSESR